MRYIILLLATVAIFLACNTGSNTAKGSFKPDNLETGQYVINIDRDTTIETKNGALLKIPKGALATDNGNTVTLEVKEAYSIQQMIQAGLTTQSNGEPLSSGGMIYIAAAAGQNVTIKQKIQVAIPSDYLQKDMQLFKGEEENGNLNWKDPVALPSNKQLVAIDTGRILFEKNCTGCHAIEKDLTAPALAHFMKRFADKEYEGGPYYFDTDNHYIARLVNAGDGFRLQRADSSKPYNYIYNDLYSCNLIRQYGSIGPHIPLTPDQYRSIYRYIQNESDRRNLPVPGNSLLDCVDSCYQYSRLKEELIAKRDFTKTRKQNLINDNGALVTRKQNNNQPQTPPSNLENPLPPSPPEKEKVAPKDYGAVYYEFTIETFGWYNIDILMKNMNGAKESSLFVRVTGQYRERMKIYLIMPSVKVYVEGGLTDRNPDEYAFFNKDGSIDLPQDAEAFILAMSDAESEESIVFGLKEFTTSTQQELSIELNASTKEQFNAIMQKVTPSAMNITVKDAKNAAQIKETNATLKEIETQLKDAEKLKPTGCDCNCGFEAPANFMDIVDEALTPSPQK